MHFFVAKLLSIAITTYTCLSRPTPKSNEPADLLCIQRINFSYVKIRAITARALTYDPTVV